MWFLVFFMIFIILRLSLHTAWSNESLTPRSFSFKMTMWSLVESVWRCVLKYVCLLKMRSFNVKFRQKLHRVSNNSYFSLIFIIPLLYRNCHGALQFVFLTICHSSLNTPFFFHLTIYLVFFSYNIPTNNIITPRFCLSFFLNRHIFQDEPSLFTFCK